MKKGPNSKNKTKVEPLGDIFPKSLKVKAYMELFRPFTLLAPAIGGTCAAIMGSAHNDFENFTVLKLVYGVGTLVIVNIASNTLNAAYDVHIDKINKPYRPIPQGIISRDEALTIAWFLYLITLWRVATFFNTTYSFLVLIIMLVTIIYSAPPCRLKKRLWLSNISIAATRGMIGFVAGWSIFDDPLSPFTPTPWIIGFIMFIFLIGATTSKDFTDVKGDRKYGIRTLPVVYGTRRASIITAPFFVFPYLLIPIFSFMDYLNYYSNFLVIFVAWGFYVIYLLKNETMMRDTQFENSPVWKHMYLMLMSLQIGFMISFILPLHTLF